MSSDMLVKAGDQVMFCRPLFVSLFSTLFDLDPDRFAFAHPRRPRRPACSSQPRVHFSRLFFNPRLSQKS